MDFDLELPTGSRASHQAPQPPEHVNFLLGFWPPLEKSFGSQPVCSMTGDGLLRRCRRAKSLRRYHQPSQFAWRLFRIAQRKVRQRLPASWVFDGAQQPARWRAGAREAAAQLANRRLNLWPRRTKEVAEQAEGTFSFLNQTRVLRNASGGIDWNPDAPRLWRFHLQCQDMSSITLHMPPVDNAYQER